MTGGAGIGAIVLAVCGGVVYHMSAKSIPKDLPPALTLVVAYAAALLISAVAHLSLTALAGSGSPGLSAAPGRALSGVDGGRLVHPAVIGLGLGAAMIELGYVLTYRAAWSVSVASVIVNGIVAAMLVPLGVLLFGEHLSSGRALGLLLVLSGVWLLRQ
jgi:multidrug transporter EmrE-like cation transporter